MDPSLYQEHNSPNSASDFDEVITALKNGNASVLVGGGNADGLHTHSTNESLNNSIGVEKFTADIQTYLYGKKMNLSFPVNVDTFVGVIDPSVNGTTGEISGTTSGSYYYMGFHTNKLKYVIKSTAYHYIAFVNSDKSKWYLWNLQTGVITEHISNSAGTTIDTQSITYSVAIGSELIVEYDAGTINFFIDNVLIKSFDMTIYDIDYLGFGYNMMNVVDFVKTINKDNLLLKTLEGNVSNLTVVSDELIHQVYSNYDEHVVTTSDVDMVIPANIIPSFVDGIPTISNNCVILLNNRELRFLCNESIGYCYFTFARDGGGVIGINPFSASAIIEWTTTSSYVTSSNWTSDIVPKPNIGESVIMTVKDSIITITVGETTKNFDVSMYYTLIDDYSGISGVGADYNNFSMYVKEVLETNTEVLGKQVEELAETVAAVVGGSVDLVLFAGQSNMAGRGSLVDALDVPTDWGYEFRAVTDPTQLYSIDETVTPFGYAENNDNLSDGTSKTGGLVPAFINNFFTACGVPIVGVSASKGGTTSASWVAGSTYLTEAISRLNLAKNWLIANGYSIRHIYCVWCQGESDGDASITENVYKTNLESLYSALAVQGVEKVMLIRIGEINDGTGTQYDTIISAQTELCSTNKDFVLVGNIFADFRTEGLMKDYYHYYQEGYNKQGAQAGSNCAFYWEFLKEPIIYDNKYASPYISKTLI